MLGHSAVGLDGALQVVQAKRMQAWTATLFDFVKAHQDVAPAIVFAFAFAESLAFLSLVVPAWAVLVAVGALAGSIGLPLWPIIAAATLGAAAGDWLSFELGSHFKAGIAKAWPLSRYPEFLVRAQAFFKRWGVAAIFFGRFSGPLRAFVPLVAGISQMQRLTFQLANVASAFIWAAALLAPGRFFGAWLDW